MDNTFILKSKLETENVFDPKRAVNVVNPVRQRASLIVTWLQAIMILLSVKDVQHTSDSLGLKIEESRGSMCKIYIDSVGTWWVTVLFLFFDS